MKTYAAQILFLFVAATPVASMAQSANPLLDLARTLSPGGNTIGGPGIFSFQPNQGVNVMDLSSTADSICASVLLLSGRVDVSLLLEDETVIESSTANATPGVGGVTSGATACANGAQLVEVRCSSTSTEPCRGVWRVDKK